MCRQMAAPSGMSRKETIEILLDFQGQNTDGVGYAYVKDGEFVTRKYPTSLSKVLRKDKTFLDHMPHDGWTIIHLRAGTHGANKVVNTHPFVVNDWCVAHNGVWGDQAIARVCMAAFGGITFEGQTDSEVAANLLAKLGPAAFVEAVEYGGVYLGLKLDGSLYTIKTSGDLEYVKKGNQIVIASKFNETNYPERYESIYGWALFDSTSKLIEKHPIKFETNVKEGDREVFESEFAQPFANGFGGYGGFGDMRQRSSGKVLGLTEVGHKYVAPITHYAD